MIELVKGCTSNLLVLLFRVFLIHLLNQVGFILNLPTEPIGFGHAHNRVNYLSEAFSWLLNCWRLQPDEEFREPANKVSRHNMCNSGHKDKTKLMRTNSELLKIVALLVSCSVTALKSNMHSPLFLLQGEIDDFKHRAVATGNKSGIGNNNNTSDGGKVCPPLISSELNSASRDLNSS